MSWLWGCGCSPGEPFATSVKHILKTLTDLEVWDWRNTDLREMATDSPTERLQMIITEIPLEGLNFSLMALLVPETSMGVRDGNCFTHQETTVDLG